MRNVAPPFMWRSAPAVASCTVKKFSNAT